MHTFSRQRGTEKAGGETSDKAVFFSSNSGCAAGSSCRGADRGVDGVEQVRGALFNTPVIRHEYDPVKPYGHASLFNEHYLSQRLVYAQELSGASPNLKGKKKCGAFSTRVGFYWGARAALPAVGSQAFFFF